MASITSASRTLSISSKPSQIIPSLRSGKAVTTAISLSFGTTPQELLLRSTQYQRGDFIPILVTMRLYCILQHGQLDTLASTLSAGVGTQDMRPSIPTLTSRSTRNQRRNGYPILATQRLYCILQLDVFVFCPFTRTSSHLVDAGIQDIVPSVPAPLFRSTRNQHGNCTPILPTVRLYRILQLAVFVFCPFTRTFIREIDAGIQDIVPSSITLLFRSTGNQRGNCTPILATVRLYRILQLAVFVFCQFTRTSTHQADLGFQGIMPSVPALFFSFDPEPAWQLRTNSRYPAFVLHSSA
jgi:hypothetical protein